MEDYKQKYEEALENIKAIKAANKDNKGLVDFIEFKYPEIKEPKDERIRKNLIKFFRDLDALEYKEEDIIAWLEKQGEPQDKGEISDGYHTFNELYYYRMLYNAAFFNLLPKEWVHKSKRHHTGEECFGGGWFIVMANLPTGQISNHYELKDWSLFKIPEKEFADEWDGHTPQEAADRLHKYLLEKQGEQSLEEKVNEAMREVEEKAKAFSAAHKGETSEEILAQMRGEWMYAEWSEEDERLYQGLIEDQKKVLSFVSLVDEYKSQYTEDLEEVYRKRIAWLKSLKERMKGEQNGCN